MTKLNPIKYIENMLSHHPKSFYLWITDGIVIDDKRYIIKEFRFRNGKLYAVISENKYNPKYFEVQLSPDEETLKAIYKAIEDNKIAIKTEIADRKNEITRVDAAIKANTTKINQEITDRKSEIARVDKAINANTTKINQEITDRKNEITRVDGAINANTTKINQEITDRTNEISRVDAAIKANTTKIDKETTDRENEITRVDAAINKEIADRTSEITRVDNVVKSNTAKIDKEITDRTSEVARLDKAIKDNKGSIDQEVTSINNAINANTTKIEQEITNRQNEINRVDESINTNTTKINQEIADRKSEITHVNTVIDSNTTKINKEITDRTNEIAHVDSAIKANTAKIDKETTDRKSEITRVEGKIPKSAGGRNLALGTSANWSSGWTNFNGQNNQTNVIYCIYNRGFKIGDKVHVRIVLKYSDIVVVEGKTASAISQCAGNVTNWNRGQLDSGGSFNFDGSSGEIELKGTTVVDEHIIKNEYWNWHLRVDYVASGKIQWKEAKAEVGDLPTPWSPAPEDYDTKLATVKSEIKQTTDAITTKVTSAQSTADNATTKANAAQTTANNNAQTIGTHTTQISTLNSSLAQKQDKLTAGTGIAIQDNIISTTGSSTPQHDTQKEQVLASTQSTITITHGTNGTSETTKLDTNPLKVLEHDNLLTDYGISKNTSGNTTKLGIEYTSVPDGFELNNFYNGNIKGLNLNHSPQSNKWYYVSARGDNNFAFQEAKLLTAPNTTYIRLKDNGVWKDWREQVGDKSVIDAAISANTTKINQEIQDRTNEITRVDAAINKEIADRTSEITRVDNVVKSNTAKIDKEITDRTSEVARLDKAIKDNKGSIDQEVTRINNAINANTTKINQEITDRTNINVQIMNKVTALEEKVAELQGKAYKKINIETTDYTGYYSVYDGKVIKYDVIAKDGKYLDLRNFTFSDGTSPIKGVTFDSNSLSVIYKVQNSLGNLTTYDNFAKFSINDQNKIIIDQSSISQLLRNNLDKVTSFSYITINPNYDY